MAKVFFVADKTLNANHLAASSLKFLFARIALTLPKTLILRHFSIFFLQFAFGEDETKSGKAGFFLAKNDVGKEKEIIGEDGIFFTKNEVKTEK